MTMNRRYIQLLLMLLLITAGVILTFYIFTDRAPKELINEQQLSKYEDKEEGIAFSYSSSLTVSPLTEADKKDHIIFRLTRNKPATIITVKTEKNLQAITTIAKQTPIDLLVNNAEKAFPARYTNYKLLSNKRLKVQEHDGTELIFTYAGPSGETAKQRLLIVMRNVDTAILLAAQAIEADFQSVDTADFQPLIDSISIN